MSCRRQWVALTLCLIVLLGLVTLTCNLGIAVTLGLGVTRRRSFGAYDTSGGVRSTRMPPCNSWRPTVDCLTAAQAVLGQFTCRRETLLPAMQQIH